MAAASNDRAPLVRDPALLVRALLVAAAVAIFVVVGMASLATPSPVAASAPATEFSATRAMKHLEVIAARPHRMGSPAHDEVRAYLLRELASLGLATETQETTVAQLRFAERWGLPARVATVKNVIARLRGSEGGRAVLLMAHYDTRSMTPGAGDDGAGVAALLETARALVAGERPKRDVLFVVTDGEELGLLGAKAFIDEHPAAREVAIVMNFDARGDRGPALMFQTSDRAAHLVAEFARLPHVAANSLSQAVYKRMPNDTDLSEWLPTGVDALNFGYIAGLDRYHSPTDTVANMDAGTLQHVGAYALPLARRFASMPLPLARDADATYFAVGPFFVRHPARADVPIAIAATLGAIGAAAFAVRRKRARVGAIAASIGVAIGVALVAAILAHLVWTAARSAHPDYAMIVAARDGVRESWGIAFAVLALAIALGAHALLATRLRAIEVGLGAAVLLGAIAVPATIALPGGGWSVAWPVIGAIVPLAIAVRRDADTPVLDVAACAVPIVLLAPVLVTFYLAFGPDAAPVVAGLVAIVATLGAPALRHLLPDRRVAPAIVAAIALAAIAVAWTKPPFDRTAPRPTTLFFAADLDAKRSWWVSPDAPNEWTAKVMSGAVRGALPAHMFAFGGAELSARDVPHVDLPAARVEVVKDDRKASRSLDLRVVPPAHAELVVISVPSGVTAARVRNRSVPARFGALVFYYSAPPPDGFALSLEAEGEIAVSVTVQRPGFPRVLGDAVGPRPETLIAKPGMLPPWDEMQESDMTVSVQRVVF